MDAPQPRSSTSMQPLSGSRGAPPGGGLGLLSPLTGSGGGDGTDHQGLLPRSVSSSTMSPATALSRSRLGTIIGLGGVLLVLCVYTTSLLAVGHNNGASSHESGAKFLMSKSGSSPGGAGSMDDDLGALRKAVTDLATRVKAVEAEHNSVVLENEKLRLDIKVEQSNLKSLTKSKNDVIKDLTARMQQDPDKRQDKDCGHGSLMEQQLQKEKEALRAELKEAQARLDDYEGGPHNSKVESVANVIGEISPDLEKQILELFYLARRDVTKFFKTLEETDPLGVLIKDPEDFKCPGNETRLTLPDLRQTSRLDRFRAGGGVIFFQHMRKAGGTAFCDLATRNMPGQTPKYFCMPDHRGSLQTPPWRTQWIKIVRENGYRMAANEWDAMTRSRLDTPDLVLMTTMRDPMDRWYSQYRFEHLEHRDQAAKVLPFARWYRANIGINMGDNYYVKTFIGEENPPDHEALKKKGPKGVPIIHGDFYWTYRKYRNKEITWKDFRAALDTMLRFHFVLVLEWLADSDHLVEKALGWSEKPRQVLPHEHGQRGSDKASKSARALLTELEYREFRDRNALDFLFYHVARRIYLEHYSCGGF